MSLNGISTSTYKADRQIAKLALAQAKRQGRIVEDDGTWSGPVDSTKPYYRARNIYDITQLPTVYTAGDNNTNNVTDNANSGGLVYGRPWTISTSTETTYTMSIRSFNTGTMTPGAVITTCNEGDFIWIQVDWTNLTVPGGSDSYLQLGGVDITNQDLSIYGPGNALDPIPWGSDNYAGPTAGSEGAPLQVVTDNTTEGNETLTWSWYVNSATVATASITIVDTSQYC